MSKSAYKRPPLPKPNPKSQQDPQFDHEPIILSSDDDDLSLTIAKKSKLGAHGDETSTNPSSSDTQVVKKTMKTKEKNEALVHGLENAETKEDNDAPKESNATTETGSSEKSDDIVLRKLRGGDCFTYKKGSHRAKDCAEKSNWGSQSAKICLNCGDFGHEMFTCNEDKYSLDDLKEIQCYVCKCFGHICCAKYAGERSREVSCYRCGQLGHSGLECARVHAESGSNWTPSSCYMCRKEAHMACKCTVSSKSEKRTMGPSRTKKKKKSRRKRNKKQPSSSQLKPGGWITEVPHAYNHNHGWGTPNIPAMYITNDGFHGGNGYQPSNNIFHGGNGYQPANNRFHGGNGFQSSNNRFHGGNGFQSFNDRFHGVNGFHNFGYNSPSFYSNQGNFQYGSAVGSNGYQNRFSVPRFGNSSNI